LCTTFAAKFGLNGIFDLAFEALHAGPPLKSSAINYQFMRKNSIPRKK
jgi:hypothetical protein